MYIEDRWKAWFRNNPELDSQIHGISIMDTDMWVHKFGERRGRITGWDRGVQYLMKIEVKTWGASVGPAQMDTINAVDNLLRTKPWKEHRIDGRLVSGHPQNVRKVFSRIADQDVRIICHGVHILRMDKDTPGTSDWLKWDEREITVDTLLRIMRYEVDPDSLRALEHREHKKASDQPPLFNSEGITA